MASRSQRKSLDIENDHTPEQKTVSQRARNLFGLHRKRLTVSGGRGSKALDTLNETEGVGGVFKVTSVSPPKKAKRILGLTDSPPVRRRSEVPKENRENDFSLFLTPEQHRTHRAAPLATMFDDSEDFSTVPCGDTESASTDAVSVKVNATRTSSIDRSSRSKTTEGTPLRSIPSTIGRSFSAIRSAGRSLHLVKVRASVASLNSVAHSEMANNNDLISSNLERTPTKSSLSLVRQLSSSSVSRVASAILKGIVTGPRAPRSKNIHRADTKEHNVSRRSSRRLSIVSTDEERLKKQRERYNCLKSAIHVLKGEITDLATTDKLLYDAIVCDISSSCKPISAISKLVLENVGDEIIEDVDSELILKKKFVLTESGKFKACKYIFFVIDYGTPGYMEKTWQDMRYVFHNFIEKAIEHGEITSLLLPYLYTGEPLRDQEKVANAAISSINHLVQQIGLGNITKLDIGGVKDERGCYEFYSTLVEKMLASMAPEENEYLPSMVIDDTSVVKDTTSLNTTVIDDSFCGTCEASYFESSPQFSP